jgi:hypothetical protein
MTEPTEPVDPGYGIEPIAWLPTPQDVADVLRARTKDDQSAEIGAWTANTRPTEYEVRGLIETAAGDTLAAVGPLTVDYEDPEGSARSLCTYRAAMLVELSYWPEQVAANQSAYAEYRTMWTDGVAALADRLVGSGAAGGGGAYSAQYLSSTRAYVAGAWIGGYAPLAAMAAANLPEPETAEPILPTDPVEISTS